ncbi:MAG: hypothetical protein ACYTG7_17495 [Planctomycetota bacterium]|jgi:hypothetical protein
MTNKLSINIFRLLRHRVRHTSLRRLGQAGMKNVSILNLKDMKCLIQEAVNNTLSDFGISLSQEELEQINDRTREEFLRILTDRDDLKASMKNMETELKNLKDNFHLLRTELEVNQRLLVKEEQRVIEENITPLSPENMESLEASLAARWNDLLTEYNADDTLKDKAIRFTLNLIAKEREKAMFEARGSQEDRVENLKRRIAKLSRKLEETEDLLERVKTERRIDRGVPSEYTNVQGLSPDAHYQEEKAALLKEIFTLNMDLKKLMAET